MHPSIAKGVCLASVVSTSYAAGPTFVSCQTKATSAPANEPMVTGLRRQHRRVEATATADAPARVKAEQEPKNSRGHHQHDTKEKGDRGASRIIYDINVQYCQFHAEVEHHVIGVNWRNNGSHTFDEHPCKTSQCATTDQDFNVGLRVGLLFVILFTSALGVIVSTAFIHLYTYAPLMFSNDCVGELAYSATTSAIAMTGMLLSFVVEYTGQRIVSTRFIKCTSQSITELAKSLVSPELVGILVMEAGIFFHSLLIGLTLAVSSDGYFVNLFIVVLFHQIFEGLALGSRIAAIGTRTHVAILPALAHHGTSHEKDGTGDSSENTSSDEFAEVKVEAGLPMTKRLSLAALFAFVTPVGMAIGIGVLDNFNGNDKTTLIAIGTLNALCVGILAWVGLVEMWAADWTTGAHGLKAELADAPPVTVALAVCGLVTGMALMSLWGKWA